MSPPSTDYPLLATGQPSNRPTLLISDYVNYPPVVSKNLAGGGKRKWEVSLFSYLLFYSRSLAPIMVETAPVTIHILRASMNPTQKE